MKSVYSLLFLALILVLPCAANNLNYGLKFNSYEALANERTGMLLDDGEYIDVSKELTLSSDLQYRAEKSLYGSVVRIVSESSASITLGFSSDGKNERYPVLVINDEIIPIISDIKYDEWLNIKITISNKNQEIILKYNNFSKTFNSRINDWKKVKICFGKCTIPKFTTEEVPSISVKDVKLTRNSKLIRHWILNKHSKLYCYDEIENAKATIINPTWIIDSYTRWNKCFSLFFDNYHYTQYAFDPHSGIIYFVPDEKSVIAYNTHSDTKEIIEVKGGRPASQNTNHLIFNPSKNELLSYNLEAQFFSSFSFETKRWSENRMPDTSPNYWHHTANFWAGDSSVITFGGYGFYQYKNDLIRINTSDNNWKTDKINSISPRYSSASVIVNDTLFIFSGEGNKTGKQEIKTTITTDLYAIDLKTLSVFLVWELTDNSNKLPCGNMVYNSDENCFYVLVNNPDDGIQSLLKISKHEPVIKELTSVLSQELNADYNFYTLMKPENEDKLFALFCRDYNAGNSKVDVYSIAYPPIPESDTLQLPLAGSKNHTGVVYIIAIVFFSLILLIGFTLIKRRANRNRTNHNSFLDPTNNEEHYHVAHESHYYNRKAKSISLLGLFNVKDCDGNDITNQFTPILKNIILVIILNSNEKSPGINSKVIDSLIWPDKDEKSARNNRNVSMNRLNIVLEKVGDVQVHNQNSFWKIIVNDNTFCDYMEAVRFMSLPKESILADKELTSQLLELLNFGQLLPFTQNEWLDSYKAAYSDFALDFLLGILSREDTLNNSNLGLRISNLIFLFDSLNEEALNVKCKLLYKQGKKSLAKNTYNSFCKEYQTLLGEKYTISLSKIIGEK